MSVRNTFPQQRPTLNLDFANSKTLDPRITFTRSQTGNGVTYVDESGFIRDAVADEPRFDHDPETGECLGLLIEEQRSNLVTYSEKIGGLFSSYGWANQNSITVDVDTTDVSDPSGGNSASKLTNGSSSPVSQTLKTCSLSATVYTASVYLRTLSGTETASINVFLQSSPYTTIATSGVLTITSEWRRYDITTSTATSADYNFGIQVRSGTIYAWGAQLEAGTFPTSYIPTSGSTATRNRDTVSMTGDNFSDWYNQSEGSFYMNIRNIQQQPTGSAYTRLIDLRGTPTGDNYYLLAIVPNGRAIYNEMFSNGSSQLNYSATYPVPNSPTGIVKITTGLQQNNFIAYNFASQFLSDTSSVTLPILNTLYIGRDQNGGSQINGHISKLTYYPTRLSNDQLQNLTK